MQYCSVGSLALNSSVSGSSSSTTFECATSSENAVSQSEYTPMILVFDEA